MVYFPHLRHEGLRALKVGFPHFRWYRLVQGRYTAAKKHKPSKAHHGGDDDGGHGGGHDDGGHDDGDGHERHYYARDSAPVRRALDIEKYCRGAPVQCCSTMTMISNPVTGVVASLVGATLPGAEVPIGLGCSPMIGDDDYW